MLDHGLLAISNVLRDLTKPLRMLVRPTQVFQPTRNLASFQDYSGFVEAQKSFLDAVPVQRMSASIKFVAAPTEVFQRMDE
jgi:hypothetical protein